MKFMLGCNYWDSKNGTDMWRKFDASLIESDIKALAENGVRFIRCFPNWRDFQPVEKLYHWRNNDKCYVDAETEQPLDGSDGIDEKQIENFRTFANICDKYNIELQVSVVTGWMSGRLFTPLAIHGKNPIMDAEALMWENKFIQGFVGRLKDCKNIVMWGLGNESNCMGPADTKYDAYVWTAYVRNSIKSADPSRPISSSMHGLEANDFGWTIKHQGEICDYMCNHPYVSRSLSNDIDLMNKMRSTVMPTVQCAYYADLAGKPTILEEQGSFSRMLGNQEVAADFARINMFSALAHNVKGYLWWCGPNHVDLKNPPYPWSMIERDLGLLETDNSPKPVAKAMKYFGEVLDKLPVEELSERQRDAVIMLTDDVDKWGVGSIANILSKQAGIECSFTVSDDPVPDSKLYIVPSIAGWSVMHQRALWGMRDKVRVGGATMFITYNGSQFGEVEEILGLTSYGILKKGMNHTAEFPFGNMTYWVNAEAKLESVGAEVLARNEEGNIVFSKHKYGKGLVYFLNMPLEANLINKACVFDDSDYYKFYKIVGEEAIKDKVLVSNNTQVYATLHPYNDGFIAVAMNYSNVPQKCDWVLKDGYVIEAIHGSFEKIDKCDGAIYYIEKK
ncbi:MAG: hypothetical protein IJ946_03370 [Clostridia bacterium]|nr:hypothetical protein [Clostridia bacterium]